MNFFNDGSHKPLYHFNVCLSRLLHFNKTFFSIFEDQWDPRIPHFVTPIN